jgi:hypothetical protein
MAATKILARNARRLHVLGAAIAAALIVDAAFVDLEPGASVTSHLPRTMAMLALLVAIAAASRRLPRGVRPFLARVLGTPARPGHTLRVRYP